MTKKLMRGLVPVMVLSAAVALFTGCGSKDSGADSKPAGDSKETEAASSAAASEDKGFWIQGNFFQGYSDHCNCQ